MKKERDNKEEDSSKDKTTVVLPKDLLKEVGKVVNTSNGRYSSSSHYVRLAIQEKLQRSR